MWQRISTRLSMNVTGAEIDEPLFPSIRKSNFELINHFPLAMFSESKRSAIDKRGNRGFNFFAYNTLELINRYIVRIVIDHVRANIDRLKVQFLPIVINGSDVVAGLSRISALPIINRHDVSRIQCKNFSVQIGADKFYVFAKTLARSGKHNPLKPRRMAHVFKAICAGRYCARPKFADISK